MRAIVYVVILFVLICGALGWADEGGDLINTPIPDEQAMNE
jgi:hypothetical protein